MSRDMTIYSFQNLDVRFELSQEEEIPNISAPGPQIKKVSVFGFLFVAQERRYGHYLIFYVFPFDATLG